MTGWTFERVAVVDGAATGVAWDGTGVLFSVPAAGRIMRFVPERGAADEYRRHSGGIDGIAVAASGTVYGCQSPSRRIVRLNADGSTSVLPYKLAGRLHNNPRELDVDTHGRVWFSDPHRSLRIPGPDVFPLLDHASVLRLDRIPGRGWHMRRMTFDTVAPGAVLLSADELTLFVAENAAPPAGQRELRAYPIDGDELGPYEVLHAFGRDHRGSHRGVEGMCLDRHGNVVACAGGERSGPGAMVYVFSPSGRVLATEPVPADPVGCAFGGSDLASLYVSTTMGELHRVNDSGLRGLDRSRAGVSA